MANNRQRFPFRPMEVPPKKSETSELCSPRLVVDTWLFRSPLPLRPMNAAQGIPGANKRRPPLLLSSQISFFWGRLSSGPNNKSRKEAAGCTSHSKENASRFFHFFVHFCFLLLRLLAVPISPQFITFSGETFFFSSTQFLRDPGT